MDDGVTAPLMATPVTCWGVPGYIQHDELAGITYRPRKPRSSAGPCSSSCCRPQHAMLQIPGWAVLGAALESPSSFRVWWCKPVGSGSSSASGPAGAPRLRLRKSPPFACASGSEAAALVQRIRRAAAWRMRDTPPHVVAVINPASGQGRSQRLFQRNVLPLLEDAAGMVVTTLVTQHAGHASELVSQLDVAAADALLFVGGDGTVYEGVQGLLGRPDWEAARQLPIAHCPGGSGNGLAHSAGLHDATAAALAVIKGVACPLDVASVLQPPGTRRYLLLSACWGSMANLDVNTEHLRRLGDMRFTLGALWECLKCRSYDASIAWLPAEEPAATVAAAAAAGAAVKPQAAAEPASPGLPVSVAVGCGSVEHDSAGGAHQTPLCVADFPAGPELPLLQQLGPLPMQVPQTPEGLPPGWQVWHEPVQTWALVNPPYVAAHYQMNPLGSLNSGHMNMMWLHGLSGLRGRLQALEVQVKAEKGDHIHLPCLAQHTVRALMLEPRSSGTHLQIDGEVIPASPIYLEVHASLLNMLVSPASMSTL